MKVSQAIEMLKKRKPEEKIVMAWFTHDDFDVSVKDWDEVIDDVIHHPTVDDWSMMHETIIDVLEELLEDKS